MLKALGLDQCELVSSESAMDHLRTFLDSPLHEPQLRAIVAIFGSAIPLDLGDSGDTLAIDTL